MNGECDSIPESCFLFAGTIDDVLAKFVRATIKRMRILAAFPLKIMTPDGVAFDGAVTSVSCRTINGQLQLLARHIDICTALGMGEAHIKMEDGTVRRAACMGGMLSMLGGECHLLATTFEWADAIDAERAARSEAVPKHCWPRRIWTSATCSLPRPVKACLGAQQRGRPQGYLNPTALAVWRGAFRLEPAAKHCGQCLKRPAALAFCARTRYNTDMNTAMIYILIMNVIGFCLMGLDKHLAHGSGACRRRSCLARLCWAAVPVRGPVCTCSITRRATGIL